MRFKLQKQEGTKSPLDHMGNKSEHAEHSGHPASSASKQNPANTVAEACQSV